MPTLTRFSPLLLALTLLCAALPAQAAEPRSTILSGKVVTTVTRWVPFPFNAVVDEVLVTPGAAVTEGQPLVRYHLQEEAERVLQREITMGAGNEGQRIQVLAMERELAQISAERNKAKQLVASRLGSSKALGRLEDDVAALQQRIALTRAAIEKTEATHKARLTELEGYYGVPIKAGGRLPHSLTLTAPLGGHVLHMDNLLHAGALLSAGTAFLSIGQLNPMLIQVQVYEADLGRIKVGDTATVQIPSLRDKQFTARVSKIAWTSNDMNVANPSFYAVELTVPNPDLELKPGFKAVVHFGKQAAPNAD